MKVPGYLLDLILQHSIKSVLCLENHRFYDCLGQMQGAICCKKDDSIVIVT